VEVTWKGKSRGWVGTVPVGNQRIRIAILSRKSAADDALLSAQASWLLLAPMLKDAPEYAARRLLSDYNYQNSFRENGEQLSVDEFIGRMHLEGIVFRPNGLIFVFFTHELHQGDCLFAGGLVLVQVTALGRFRTAAWVTQPDSLGFWKQIR
jgi:hypothetical protein